MRETASGREACEEESLDILRKLEPTEGEITQAALSHTKSRVVKSRESKIETSFKMKARGFHR